MTRVAFLTPSLHIGGAERWIVTLANHLRQVQATGVVCCSPHFHPQTLDAASRRMTVYLARKVGDVDETARLLRTACHNAEVLVSWGIPGLARVTRGLKIPVVDVSHSDGAWTSQTQLVRRAAAGADFYVGVSQAALRAFPPEVQTLARVIYNGVEVDRIAPRRGRDAQRQRWQVTPQQRVLLFLGRFDPVKGPLRLAAAMNHLPRDYVAVFYGHGPQSSALAKVAKQIGESRIRILPPTSVVGDVLAGADQLIMPSHFEGMPLTLVEAWLARVPTVTTRFAFVDEAQHRHGELVASVGLKAAPAELAAAIFHTDQGRDGQTVSQRVERAYDAAWQRYTAAAMAQRWDEYLTAVVCQVKAGLPETNGKRRRRSLSRELPQVT